MTNFKTSFVIYSVGSNISWGFLYLMTGLKSVYMLLIKALTQVQFSG